MEGRLVWYSEELRGEGGGWSGLYDRKRGGEGRTVIVTLSRTLIFGVYDADGRLFSFLFFPLLSLSRTMTTQDNSKANCAQKKKMGRRAGVVKVVTLPLPLSQQPAGQKSWKKTPKKERRENQSIKKATKNPRLSSTGEGHCTFMRRSDDCIRVQGSV